MPAAPSVLKAIAAVRKAIAGAGQRSRPRFELYGAILDVFRQADKIVGDIDTLRAVLDLGPEIEAFRGKGSQSAASDFARNVGWLVYKAKERLPRHRPSGQDRTPARGRIRRLVRGRSLGRCPHGRANR
jgi:hypothetical protein